MHNDRKAAHVKPENIGGLWPFLCLARGTRVMITSNLWIQKGLVNGATGTLRHFIFKKDEKPPSLPLALVVQMDRDYKGPELNGKPRLIYVMILFKFNTFFN